MDENKNDKKEEIEIVADEEMKNTDLSGKIGKMKEELKVCESQRKEYLDGWQRSKADFINYKKDEAKRFEETARFIAAGFIYEILPVLDSFEMAFSHGLPADTEKGLLLIRSQLSDILKKMGLEIMNTEGQKFNPEFHESLGEVESAQEEGMVAEEIQKGYLFNGRVLRPARVKIAKSRIK